MLSPSSATRPSGFTKIAESHRPFSPQVDLTKGGGAFLGKPFQVLPPVMNVRCGDRNRQTLFSPEYDFGLLSDRAAVHTRIGFGVRGAWNEPASNSSFGGVTMDGVIVAGLVDGGMNKKGYVNYTDPSVLKGPHRAGYVANKELANLLIEHRLRIGDAVKLASESLRAEVPGGFASIAVTKIYRDQVFIAVSGSARAFIVKNGELLRASAVQTFDFKPEASGRSGYFYNNPRKELTGAIGDFQESSPLEFLDYKRSAGARQISPEEVVLVNGSVAGLISPYEIAQLSNAHSGVDLQNAIYDLAHQRNTSRISSDVIARIAELSKRYWGTSLQDAIDELAREDLCLQLPRFLIDEIAELSKIHTGIYLQQAIGDLLHQRNYDRAPYRIQIGDDKFVRVTPAPGRPVHDLSVVVTTLS